MTEKTPLDLLDERNSIAAELEPLGYVFTGGGSGFGMWDMDLEYPGWELFLTGDGSEYGMRAYPAERDEDDDATFTFHCATREEMIEHLTALREQLTDDNKEKPMPDDTLYEITFQIPSIGEELARDILRFLEDAIRNGSEFPELDFTSSVREIEVLE